MTYPITTTRHYLETLLTNYRNFSGTMHQFASREGLTPEQMTGFLWLATEVERSSVRSLPVM